MCAVCCQEFKGWWRSFTKIECLSLILELLLLMLLFFCVVFTILHLQSCGHKQKTTVLTHTTPPPPPPTDTTEVSLPLIPSKCTWKPSHTTKARTHYYEQDAARPSTSPLPPSPSSDAPPYDPLQQVLAAPGAAGERAHAAVLVRGGRVLCALAAVAPRWALGTAACVLAARPRSALRVAGAAGDAPLLGLRARGGAGLALLRVERPAALPARLPAPLDALTLALGDHLTLLQFDPEGQPSRENHGVSATGAVVLGRARCGAGAAELCAACGEAVAAAGGAAASGGGLLLRDGMLLGVGAERPCPQAPYLSVAPSVDWIRETILYDTYE